ncbi:uncharacterized protein LOC104925459 [Larimichthys crocea]|uniref:uncharacterized protein LOC104925459 n=1 Tax=Larimichthys crocea TaxID=215358 RepID=UPI000F5F302E|nr:uncharacterized protein LOC104925459 [Larimichthys crocea]
MSKPIPLPRGKIFNPEKTKDAEALKCSSPPQSPTTSSKGDLVRSTPPPVPPKKLIFRKSPGGVDTVNSRLEILKVVAKPPPLPVKPPKEQPDVMLPTYVVVQPTPLLQQTSQEQPDDRDKNLLMARPPSPPVRSPREPPDENLDDNTLLDWWSDVIPWKYLCKDLKSRGKKERKIVKLQAEHLYKAVQVYILLLSQHGSFLKERNTELLCIADNLDKVSKNTKIAGITGGATTVAGGVAAAAGVILSPFTLGVSLALTVIGVGVAAAGGVTGASAAIVNKVNVTQDKKKIEKTFQEYESRMEDIQGCLKFINEGMEEIKQHDLSFLIEAMKDSVKIATVIQLVTTGGGSARALEATSKASGVMKGFALGIGIHFTKDKDGQRLKRGHESKLAKKIRTLAVDVSEALDELMQMKDMFSKHFNGEEKCVNL